MKRILTISTAIACFMTLAACENAKEQLGIQRDPPDEFAVVKRAPLEMPPDYSLRPPQPGAARPQEQAPSEQAKQTVFGAPQENVADRPLTEGEAILLQKTGAYNTDPNVRRTVDKETAQIAKEKKPTIQRILSVTGKKYDAPAQVVNAPAEAERIKKAQEEGKPVNEGETPTIKD